MAASGSADKNSNNEKSKPLMLRNRPGEPDFQLELSPDSVVFTCSDDRKPTYFDISLKNNSAERQGFKVKCTSGDIFRVQPPLGIVKPGEQTKIRVWFQNKQMPTEGQTHYFAFYHVRTAEGKKDRDVWTKTTRPDGVRRLLAVFQEKKN